MIDFSNFFNFDLAIDPGSFCFRAFDKSTGKIITTPTFLGYSHVNKSPIAFGKEAKDMLGRVPKGMEVIRPIQFSEIVANEYFEIFLKHIIDELKKANSGFKFKTKPKVFVPIPIDFTQSSLSNFETSILKAGASEVVFLKKLVCSSYGVGSKDSNRVKMVLDIGYQKTEFGVVYKNEIYDGRALNFGGEDLDRLILNKLIEDKKIQCSLNNIEEYKEQCLTFMPFLKENEKFKIVGKDTKRGTPITSEVSFLELREYVVPIFRIELVKQLKAFLNSLSDNIISDLYEEGIYLIGGVGMNFSLASFLTKELGIKFNSSTKSNKVSIIGAQKVIEHNYSESIKVK